MINRVSVFLNPQKISVQGIYQFDMILKTLLVFFNFSKFISLDLSVFNYFQKCISFKLSVYHFISLSYHFTYKKGPKIDKLKKKPIAHNRKKNRTLKCDIFNVETSIHVNWLLLRRVQQYDIFFFRKKNPNIYKVK